ncbi:MAG: hypothetical protein KGQ59_11495, partial [Bdellovibrionales bacterium]|nr:hypothetical protein [Bdellovibrionales bacterium]
MMFPKTKRKICGQARVSSQKQKDEATIDDQIRFLKDLFTRLGIFDGSNPFYEFVPYNSDAHTPENPSFFIDEAYNAEEEDRTTALYELLQRISLGEIDVVATYDMNRIFRAQDEVFRAQIVKTFRVAGATIFLQGQERNPADLVSLFEQFQGSAAKTVFLQNGQRGKRRRAETEGAPPSGRHKFGWRWDSHSSARKWNEIKRDTDMVRWIGCLSGGINDPNLPAPLAQALAERPFGYSHAEIAELMNKHGYSILPH